MRRGRIRSRKMQIEISLRWSLQVTRVKRGSLRDCRVYRRQHWYHAVYIDAEVVPLPRTKRVRRDEHWVQEGGRGGRCDHSTNCARMRRQKGIFLLDESEYGVV